LKGGLTVYWQLNEQIEQLAHDNNVSRNRMIVILIEVGIPVFQKIQSRSPTLARAMLQSNRYHFIKRRKSSAKMIEQIQQQQSDHVALDTRLSAGFPRSIKEAIRKEARQRNIPMSMIVREKFEVGF
jgi:isochorismate hydrolase